MRNVWMIPVLALLILAGCKNQEKKEQAAQSTTPEKRLEAQKESGGTSPDAMSTTKPERTKSKGEVAEKLSAENKSAESEAAAAEAEMMEEQAMQDDPNRHKPAFKEDTYFKMIKTPCFGRCPVYEFEVKQNGLALLDGKRFFEYEGLHQAQMTESHLNKIMDLAKQYGYFEMEHVYDAPVTDLPSTTTMLRQRDGVQWVYNRMNAPQSLNDFQMEVETLMKELQWKPMEEGKTE